MRQILQSPKKTALEVDANLVEIVPKPIFEMLLKVWVRWKIPEYVKKITSIMPNAN
jgi:hypothetical protein